MTCTPTHARTALTNVRVFDGRQLLAPGTVVVQAGRIVADTHGARVVDGAAGVLLPGLIDAHVHLHGRETLERLCGFGVTTALDMACGPPELVDSLRGVKGLTDIRSAGTPAIAPGSLHSRIPGLGHCGLVSGADEAARFVAERVAEGSDYIKIIVGNAGPSHDQATLDALVGAARAHGKLTVAHASSYAAPWRWRSGGGRRRHTRAAGLCPGLGGRGPHGRRRPHPRADAVDDGRHHRAVGTAGRALRRGRKSVATLFRAGVPILAGTDANAAPGVPAAISHGDSLHHELELLVDAGLSTVDALRAATVAPARFFGLTDRGVIEPGRRGDLVLIDGDPVHDIRATRSISRVWCGGVEHTPA